MAFIETPRFPDDLALWAVGGRGFQTIVVQTYGGDEYRQSDWDQAKGEWDISQALRLPDWQSANLYNQKTLIKYFNVCHGKAGRFRFKNYMDFKDDAAGILGLTGLAVAATTAYQMYKGYSISPLSYLQIVNKPIASTIKVYDNAVLKATPADYTLNATTGFVTFTSQPTVGHALTWTGEFDIAVRFVDDFLPIGMDQSGALVDVPTIKLIETRDIL